MKQIDDMCNGFFEHKKHTQKKWYASFVLMDFGGVIVYCHYHHIALVYAIDRNEFVYVWEGETRSDKRGIADIIEYHKLNEEKIGVWKNEHLHKHIKNWNKKVGD